MPQTSHNATALLVLYALIYCLSASFVGWKPQHLLASALLAPLLIALTVIDISTLRLPDPLTFLVFIVGIGVTALQDSEFVIWNLIAAALACLSLVSVAYVYRRYRGQPGLGLGDAKLYGAAGMWVGLDGLGSVLLIACLSALVAIALARLNGRRVTSTTPFPFGPFLCFGLWMTWCVAPPF